MFKALLFVPGLDSFQLNLVQKAQEIFSLFFFASFAPLRETFLVPACPVKGIFIDFWNMSM